MKRSTLSLLVASAILIAGIAAIWLLLVAPRLKPAPTPAPAPVVAPPKAVEMHGALNLYLAAPGTMPSGVSRVELTLIKASLVDGKGSATPIFEGVQRVMLQSGVVEKALSAIVPNGSWSRLDLEFSPSAVFSMSDGTTAAALVERREAALSFMADLPVSHSLALFARVPLENAMNKAAGTWTANLLPDPQKAESYVFGSAMLDQRGMSDLWTLPRLSLAEAIKADLGLDITSAMPGSTGFNSAAQPPTSNPPQP